ncbi:uncharacterized protein LOC127811716 isoform X3 [Diospyros lotus]|uniref:uncharacterized protein LOC127811716 isoform X3 n=1 Tax=Diospyros lotus TaxID=55363 RepID=UPI002256754E|nr:uncharacterized protein LOC127811716 isoform X3 [Diospyros lotus]
MLGCACSVQLLRKPPTALASAKQETPRRPITPFLSVTTGGSGVRLNEKLATISGGSRHSTATVLSAPLSDFGRRLSLRSGAELGLLSLFFVLSMAIGAIISLALISLPTALKRLAVSMDKLVHLVLKEVPGTLTSLRLSVLEVNELVQQLNNLRRYLESERKEK